MSHDFRMIGSEDHDFNLGWYRRSKQDYSPLKSIRYPPSWAYSILAPSKRRTMSCSPSRPTPKTGGLDG